MNSNLGQAASTHHCPFILWVSPWGSPTVSLEHQRGILSRESQLTLWVRISGQMRPSLSPGSGARAWDRVRSRQARPWPTWAPWTRLAQPTARAINHRPGSAQGSPQGLSGQGGARARQEGGVANTTRPVPKALRPLE